MHPVEIITKSLQKRGKDHNKYLHKIDNLLKDRKGFLLHENQSVLLGVYLDNHDVELHLLSHDSPLQLAHSLSKFIERVKKSHVRAVYGRADNEQIIRFLKRLGVEVEHSDRPGYNWKATV